MEQGLLKANFIGTNIEHFDDLKNPGDIGIGAINYHFSLLVLCPICELKHIIPVDGASGWQWNQNTLTLAPSYKAIYSERNICHWSLINGSFIAYSDCTGKPA